MIPISLLLSLATIATAQSSITAQDATTFALTYGYPLLAYEKVRIAASVVGVNKWLHFRDLQTPANKAVVKPNVDTLYSALVYDLSNADLLVSLPADKPASQFELISFFDPFGTNYANVGSLNTNTPGTYRLRPQIGGQDTSNASYVTTLETSSLYGFVLIRWLVNNTNLDALHGWQDRTLNATVAVPSRGPALSSLPTFNASRTPADNVIKLLTAFAPYTLPDDAALAKTVSETLAVAGISNGTYNAPQNVDLALANRTFVATVAAAAESPSVKTTLNNGWTVANASVIGIFGDNFAYRSAVANGGYLAIKAPNAIYPSWSNGTSSTALGGDFYLGPNDAYILTFTSKPPLTETGFWSVTAYQDNFLIANAYNIYAVTSERSNLTYSNGTPVYCENTTAVAMPFQILVQPADKAPPSNWTNNFLPGPAGGGALALTLRLYGAQQSLLDGNWQYPIVEKVAALTGGTLPNATSSGSPTSTTTRPTSSNPTGAALVASPSMLLSLAASLVVLVGGCVL